jgi:hypothetical protein
MTSSISLSVLFKGVEPAMARRRKSYNKINNKRRQVHNHPETKNTKYNREKVQPTAENYFCKHYNNFYKICVQKK